MSSIAMERSSLRASVPPQEQDPSPTPTAATASGPATTSPHASDPTAAGQGSIRSTIGTLVGPSELHRVASESGVCVAGDLLRSETERTAAAAPAQEADDASGKPPARTADLPPGVGTADDFKRGNK